MINYYKILKIENKANEAEIKKAFRKLAKIYHPDKNNGSADSEQNFKIILNAYETLSNKEKKIEYDVKYKEEFRSKETQNEQATNRQEYKAPITEKPFFNYNLMIFIVIVIIIWLINRNEITTTGNVNADHQLNEQKNVVRPNSGELKFKNNN